MAWGSPRQWFLLGAALGLAGLAKYTAVTPVVTAVGALRAELAARPGPPPSVFTDRWSASRLAWYGRPLLVQLVDGRPSKFDLWFGRPDAGARGVFVERESPAPAADPEALQYFEHSRLLGQQAVEEPDGRIAIFRFWECDGYRP